MDWAKLAESHPVLVPAVSAFVGGIIVLLGQRVIALIGYKTEIMKLRYSIAERRLKEFDGAAADLGRMLLEVSQRDSTASKRFCERNLAAALEVVLTAGLVMMPEHRHFVGKLQGDLLESCGRLHRALKDPEGPGVKVLSQELKPLIDTTAVLHRLMQCVDILAEVRLEGRASRRQKATINKITQQYAESKEKGTTTS